MFSKFLLDWIESTLELSEWCSKWQMLNKLDSFINSFNSRCMFTIFLGPEFVLTISSILFWSEGRFIVFNIFSSLSNILVSIFMCFSVIISQLSISCYLSSMISNSIFQIINYSITCWSLYSIKSIVFLLIFLNSQYNLIQ